MPDRVDNFLSFANALPSGYLKPWKASSMLLTIDSMPVLKEDYQRLYAYVFSSLEMEGFSRYSCERITDYLTGENNGG